jgi:hypothetical protein
MVIVEAPAEVAAVIDDAAKKNALARTRFAKTATPA